MFWVSLVLINVFLLQGSQRLSNVVISFFVLQETDLYVREENPGGHQCKLLLPLQLLLVLCKNIIGEYL